MAAKVAACEGRFATIGHRPTPVDAQLGLVESRLGTIMWMNGFIIALVIFVLAVAPLGGR